MKTANRNQSHNSYKESKLRKGQTRGIMCLGGVSMSNPWSNYYVRKTA